MYIFCVIYYKVHDMSIVEGKMRLYQYVKTFYSD